MRLGERIWGRGSSDDKSGLIGTLYALRKPYVLIGIQVDAIHSSAIETLVKSGFQPKRKIVLAFGFDEEVSGIYVR